MRLPNDDREDYRHEKLHQSFSTARHLLWDPEMKWRQSRLCSNFHPFSRSNQCYLTFNGGGAFMPQQALFLILSLDPTLRASIDTPLPHVAARKTYNPRALLVHTSVQPHRQHTAHQQSPMLIVFLLIFFFRRYGTNAAPFGVPDSTANGGPLFASDDSPDANAGRSVLGILWSCLATTFAVTWVSVHPNVPFLEEAGYMALKRKTFLMVLSLLAPEVMIMWAFKQWRGAVMIKEMINEATRPASYACMSRSCRLDVIFVD